MSHNTVTTGPKVLLVSEDVYSRRLISQTLSAIHSTVVLGPSDASILEVVERHQPDLILIDASGLAAPVGELVHHLRASRRTAPLPIVMLSPRCCGADGSHDGLADHAVAAVDRCLSKPFSPLDLLEAVERLTGVRRTAAVI